jgi:hypothetical protein
MARPVSGLILNLRISFYFVSFHPILHNYPVERPRNTQQYLTFTWNSLPHSTFRDLSNKLTTDYLKGGKQQSPP